MRCGDCNGPITGTNAEIVAQNAGLLLCEDCIDSMDDERDAYEQIMRDEGFVCVFDSERGFRAQPRAPAPSTSPIRLRSGRQAARGHGEG